MRLNELEIMDPGETKSKLRSRGGEIDLKQLSIVLKQIEHECSQIISFYKQQAYGDSFNYFIRGSKRHQNTVVYKGQSHVNRYPVDMADHHHNVVVNTMKKAGFKAHRGNSIFASGRPRTWFGPPYIIFPVNGFHYSFSSKISDFYSKMSFNPKFYIALEHFTKKNDIEGMKNFYFKDLEYKIDKGLDEALDTRVEIMFSGQYYAIHAERISQITSWIKDLK